MTLKLEVGKSYKTRGGWMAVPYKSGEGYYKVIHYGNGHDERIPLWHFEDGRSNVGREEFDLIAEWKEEEMIEELPDLTKIEKPFGLLDKKTQERLQAHGGPIQYYDVRGQWVTNGFNNTGWYPANVYRVKPAPVVEYKKTNWVTSKYTGFGYEITEKFIDGKYDSYTVDMVPF